MESSTNKAVKAGVAYTVGNILLKGISFFTLPIFNRILTPEEFGLFNVYVAYENLLTIFVGFCIYGSLRTAKYDFKDDFEQYSSSIIILSLIISGSILCIGNILYFFIAGFFEFGRLIFNILIMHSYAMFVFQFYNVKLALAYRYKRYLILSGINSVLGTLISILFILYVFADNKHEARIYGYSLVPIMLAIPIVAGLVLKNVKNRWNPIKGKYWKYALSLSIPLIVHTFSKQILSHVDRIMIKKMTNAVNAGIYSFVNAFSTILQIIVQSMNNAWSVWFYEQLSLKRYDDIKKKMIAFILLMNIIYIGFVSISPDIIRLFATKSYYEGIPLIVPLAFSMYFVFLYSLSVHIEYFHKNTKYMALGTSLASGINFILNYFAINKFGYTAAAWTTLISYVLLYIFHQIIASKIEKNPIFPYKNIFVSIFMLTVYSVLTILFINKMLVRWLMMIALLAVLIIFNRKIVKAMLTMIPIVKNLGFVKRMKEK